MDQYKDPRWQKKRLEIMQRDNFTCCMCDDTTSTLNVHHRKYILGRKPWEYEDEDFITLCEECHYLISKCDYGIEDSHKLIHKYSDFDGNIIYILAWPWDIDIFQRSKEGEVKHIAYLPEDILHKIINYLDKWQKDLQTPTNTKNHS